MARDAKAYVWDALEAENFSPPLATVLQGRIIFGTSLLAIASDLS
jgi:hypothetical protein